MTRESPALALTPNPFWDGSGQGRAGQGSRKKKSCLVNFCEFFFFLGWQCKGEGNVAFEPPMNHLSNPPLKCVFLVQIQLILIVFWGKICEFYNKIEKEKTLVAILD
jgi:hypothetical protein